MIRQSFEFARRDKLITKNPCAEVERATYQRPIPDPFSLEEVEIILADIKMHHEEQILNFVEMMFFAGLRTSEEIGLRWSDIDFLKKEMKVEGGIVYDEEINTTKTGVARKVKLNSRSMAALERQQAHIFLAGEHVFHDPKTGTTWAYQNT